MNPSLEYLCHRQEKFKTREISKPVSFSFVTENIDLVKMLPLARVSQRRTSSRKSFPCEANRDLVNLSMCIMCLNSQSQFRHKHQLLQLRASHQTWTLPLSCAHDPTVSKAIHARAWKYTQNYSFKSFLNINLPGYSLAPL